MTATAFAIDPVLDRFDDADGIIPARPQLRLIDGGGYGTSGRGVPVPARTRSTPAASIEDYRRRRFFALVAVTLIILGAAWAAGVSLTDFSGAPAAEAGTAAPTVHVVLPGDSYAAIAAELGAANPVASGQVLRALNGGGELIIGQRLVVDVADIAVD